MLIYILECGTMEQKVKVSSGKTNPVGRSLMVYERKFSFITLYESNFSSLIQVLGAEVGSYLQFTILSTLEYLHSLLRFLNIPFCLW